MPNRKIFIIVPSPVMESPVKGAIALANALVQSFPVTFVTIKKGDLDISFLNSKVNWVSLSDYNSSWLGRRNELRKMLLSAGGRGSVISISFCLSADLMNSWCSDLALTYSSVRGNLPKVYPGKYGWLGKWLAYRHLNRLKKIDHVISMTHSMSKLVERCIGRESPVVGNFIDEIPLDKFRRTKQLEGQYRFVYVGSLIHAKQPESLIIAMANLHDRGIIARLDFLGDGPLLNRLRELSAKLKVADSIKFHGFVSSPFNCVAQADAMIIPSLTEGVSRSALEALYLGVPCIMRDVDGNSELIISGKNGCLFFDDMDLPNVMLKTAIFSREKKLFRGILIPDRFRQQVSVKQYISLMEHQD